MPCAADNEEGQLNETADYKFIFISELCRLAAGKLDFAWNALIYQGPNKKMLKQIHSPIGKKAGTATISRLNVIRPSTAVE